MNPSDEGLTTGTRIGPYEVLSPLGAGGMGRVYLARDRKLDRQVAIKALPPEFATDVDRLARFQREAKFLAALNHPNIAGIYGLEASGADEYLVLEYVPGESLADRLEKGPLPVDEALEVCRQVALALEAAHESGVIHRDLKPGNVMVTPEGTVKVLDFGLAKADAISSGPSQDPTKSPTISATASGTITGTAGYMSPEQVRGKRVDKRTDVWSFGCVLYECLSGQLAFGGDSAVERLSAILEREPDWATLPASTPPRVLELLQRCLVKDPKARLRDLGDARLEIEAAISGKAWKSGPQAVPPLGRRLFWGRLAPWALGLSALLLLAAALLLWRSWGAAPKLVKHLSVVVPADLPISDDSWSGRWVAISPDGDKVAYLTKAGTANRLAVATLSTGLVKALPGTEGGWNVSFSPDGRWILFQDQANWVVKKAPADGGSAPVTVVEQERTANLGTARWGSDGKIYFMAQSEISGSPKGSLMRVPVEGGPPVPVMRPPADKGVKSLILSSVLPGGRGLMVNARTDKGRAAAWIDPSKGEYKELPPSYDHCRYLSTGHLLYKAQSPPTTVMAVPFDLGKMAPAGAPVAILEDVLGGWHLDISRDGTLAYLPDAPFWPQRALVWMDREGNSRVLKKVTGWMVSPRFSPDGGRIAVEYEDRKAGMHAWLFDLARGTLAWLPTEGQEPDPKLGEGQPVWFPSGQSVVLSNESGLCVKKLDKPGLTALSKGEAIMNFAQADDVSPDGKWLVFGVIGGGHEYGDDLWLLPLDGSGAPKPYLTASSIERSGRISPDGKWLAYFSDESGRFEVYVNSFPEPGNKTQVSLEGGDHPLWSRDGKELFYRQGDRVMAVPVSIKPALQVGRPVELFRGDFVQWDKESTWDVHPDGKHFVVIQNARTEPPRQIHIVLNWFEELKQEAPRGK